MLPAGAALLMSYSDEIDTRYSSFLLRHNLHDKFKEEDEAGKR